MCRHVPKRRRKAQKGVGVVGGGGGLKDKEVTGMVERWMQVRVPKECVFPVFVPSVL